MAAEAAAADADDGGFEAFAEAPLTASADADAATTPAEADDPSFTAFEEAPAETDAAPSDGPPAEEDPWASFPEPVAAADVPAAAPTADAEPMPEGDAWAAFDGAAAAADDDASPGVTSGSLETSSFEHVSAPGDAPPDDTPAPFAAFRTRGRRRRGVPGTTEWPSTTTKRRLRRPGMRAAHHRRRRSCASPARRDRLCCDLRRLLR